MINLVFCILVVTSTPVLVQGQTLELLDLAKTGSITNCPYTLISGVDQVVFTSRVTLNQNDTSGNVTFSILDRRYPEEVYRVFETVIVESRCLNTDEILCKMIGPYTFLLSVNFTAYTRFSESRIQGKLINSNGKVIIRYFGKLISTITDAIIRNTQLIINGRQVAGDEHDVMLSGEQLSIIAICASSGGPCIAELTVSDLAGSITDRSYINYYKRYECPFTIDVIVKYGSCSLRANPKTIKYRIQSTFDPNVDCTTNLELFLSLILFVLVIPPIYLLIKTILRGRGPLKSSRTYGDTRHYGSIKSTTTVVMPPEKNQIATPICQ